MPNDASFVPTLRVTPEVLRLAPGASDVLHVELNYVPGGPRYFRQPVSFQVMEPGGGDVGPTGRYTAPAQPGTYRIRVRRDDFPAVQVQVTVVVG